MRPFADVSSVGQVRRLAAGIRACYAAEGVALPSLRLIDHQHNTTFRATFPDGSRRFVRVSRGEDRTAAAVASEVAWIEALAVADFPVARPFRWSDGSLVRFIPAGALGLPADAEPRMVSQFRWVTGRGSNRPPARHWAAIGHVMARLQTYTMEHPQLGPDRWQVDAMVPNQGDTEQGLRAVEEVHGVVGRRLAESVGREYLAARPSLGPVIPLHGDLHQHNVLFDRDQMTVVDFDDCGYGIPIFDLAVPIREIRENRIEGAEAALVDGYRQVRDLPAGYPDALPLVLRLRTAQLLMWVCSERGHPGFASWWRTYADLWLGHLRDGI
ncbi:MAG: phosphotransferase [Fimbriimonadaceae bacterium]|nr:phosphotransferase [Fimbriimonadaceae bacterium]